MCCVTALKVKEACDREVSSNNWNDTDASSTHTQIDTQLLLSILVFFHPHASAVLTWRQKTVFALQCQLCTVISFVYMRLTGFSCLSKCTYILSLYGGTEASEWATEVTAIQYCHNTTQSLLSLFFVVVVRLPGILSGL